MTTIGQPGVFNVAEEGYYVSNSRWRASSRQRWRSWLMRGLRLAQRIPIDGTIEGSVELIARGEHNLLALGAKQSSPLNHGECFFSSLDADAVQG